MVRAGAHQRGQRGPARGLQERGPSSRRPWTCGPGATSPSLPRRRRCGRRPRRARPRAERPRRAPPRAGTAARSPTTGPPRSRASCSSWPRAPWATCTCTRRTRCPPSTARPSGPSPSACSPPRSPCFPAGRCRASSCACSRWWSPSAAFPLLGILVAQGVRGSALLAVGGLVLLFFAFFAFLADPRPHWTRAAVGILSVLGAGAAAGYFGYTPETEAQRQLREAVTAEQRFADPSLGRQPGAARGLAHPQEGRRRVRPPCRCQGRLRPPPAGGVRLPGHRQLARERRHPRRLARPRPPRAAQGAAGPEGRRPDRGGGGHPHRAAGQRAVDGLRRAPPRDDDRVARRLGLLRARGLGAAERGRRRPRRAGRRRGHEREARPEPAEGRAEGHPGGAGPDPRRGRAADGPERGAGPRTRPGLPPVVRGGGERAAHLEGRRGPGDGPAHRVVLRHLDLTRPDAAGRPTSTRCRSTR